MSYEAKANSHSPHPPRASVPERFPLTPLLESVPHETFTRTLAPSKRHTVIGAAGAAKLAACSTWNIELRKDRGASPKPLVVAGVHTPPPRSPTHLAARVLFATDVFHVEHLGILFHMEHC